MDSSSFDRLTRLVSAARSRRSLVGLGVGLVATLLGVEPVAAAPCPKGKKRCGKRCIPKKRCCTSAHCNATTTGKVCRNGRCVCPPTRPQPCQGRCLLSTECCGGCPAEQACHAGRCCIATSAGLQAALGPGGPAVIQLCPTTTYQGTFTIDRTVTVIGAGGTSTVLDGNGATSAAVVQVTAGTQVILQGLGITGGRSAEGAGILNQGTLRLTDCQVTNNHAPPQTAGGGISSFGPAASLSLVDSVVANNSAGRGGGIRSLRGSLTLAGASRVADNVATTLGGGIYSDRATVTLEDTSRVVRNDAPIGAGIAVESQGLLVLRADSRVESNTATSRGGGVHATISSTVELRDRSAVTLNQANPELATSGGGIFLELSSTAVILNEATVTGNLPDNCQPSVGACQ
jgi:hypothetical protein